jgi:hypothetical protein
MKYFFPLLSIWFCILGLMATSQNFISYTFDVILTSCIGFNISLIYNIYRTNKDI